MSVKIVDTTLRDGEQMAGVALGIEDKIQIAKKLDALGIYQIEAGIPAMGEEEKKCIRGLLELGLTSKISAWNRMVVRDLQESMELKPDIVHFSVPSSDIQIEHKLKKDRNWVLENMQRCIYTVKERGFELTVGFEDASRADFPFLLELIAAARKEGVDRVRYADTVGILYRQRIFDEITAIASNGGRGLEIHAHNDLGMAVANSVSAALAGAEYIDCTVGGTGERAGNCSYVHFLKAAKGLLGAFGNIDLAYAEAEEKEIMGIFKGKAH